MANFNLERQTRFIETAILTNKDIHPLLGDTNNNREELVTILQAMDFEIDESNISQAAAGLELFFMQLQLPKIGISVLKQIIGENRVDYVERY
ncbi:MAG: hypothetical protein QG639_520 [Patescibacteria group bacterium]|nr:hypothetical protein [Patescibacteria group bacterium]